MRADPKNIVGRLPENRSISLVDLQSKNSKNDRPKKTVKKTPKINPSNKK